MRGQVDAWGADPKEHRRDRSGGECGHGRLAREDAAVARDHRGSLRPGRGVVQAEPAAWAAGRVSIPTRDACLLFSIT